MDIQEIRSKYPQYNDMSDDELLRGLHSKHYSDMSFEEFSSKAGGSAEPDRGLAEIGTAPELNALSVPAFKTSLGLLTTGDTKSLKGIFKAQFGDDVSFRDVDDRTIVSLPSGEYELNKKGISPQDVARFAFDMASFTPAGAAKSIMGAVGKNALTETAIEGMETSVGGDFSPIDIAVAGGVGGAVKGVEDLASAAYRGIKGKSTSDVVDAGKSHDIPVYTSDATPPKTFMGQHLHDTVEKIPVIGTGGMRAVQQEAREEAVDNFISPYLTPDYHAIINSLKNKKNKVKQAAGAVMKNTGEKLDEMGAIPLEKTKTVIDEVHEELSKKGVLKTGKEKDELTKLITALDEAPQTFTSLKENRTAFWDVVDSVDGADRSQLTSRAKTLLGRVHKAMGDDMDDWAKANLDPKDYGKWRKAKGVYADEATKMQKTRLKTILDKGDVTPEMVDTMLFSKKPSEVKTLYLSLGNEGRANARSALISKVVNSLNARQHGLNPSAFATEMKKLGMNTDTFFKGKDKEALNGLLKVLDETRRAQTASATTATGQTMYGLALGLGIAHDPLVTGSLVGSLAVTTRLLESAPVRNALIRINSVPKGSDAYLKAIEQLSVAANAAAQSARD